MTGKVSPSCVYILILSVLVIPVLSGLDSPVRAQEGEKVTLRFVPAEGKIFKYKVDSHNQVFFGPYSFETVTGQEVEMSLLETLENGDKRMSVTFTKSSTKMMRMGTLIEQDPRIKPEGRTVKVEVDPKGKVVEVLGFIMGVKKGRDLNSYMEKWFFELPDETVGPGSTWTVPVDEKSEEGAEEIFSVKGSGEFELKKIKEKDGVMVAEIEGEVEVEIHTDNEQGVFDGKAKSKQKFYIAIDGGYILEGENYTDIQGKMVSQDENGKEIENDVTRIESHEIKLEK